MSQLAKSRLLTGLGYGLVVWAVINLVVVPNSVIGWRGFDLARAARAASILVVCIGITLSFLAYRHDVIRKQRPPSQARGVAYFFAGGTSQ